MADANIHDHGIATNTPRRCRGWNLVPGPSRHAALAIDQYVGHVSETVAGEIAALVSPHAGLMYSGPVAAHAYRQLAGRTYDVVVLVGPSHHVGFEGVAIVARGVFETPLGDVEVSADDADTIIAVAPGRQRTARGAPP